MGKDKAEKVCSKEEGQQHPEASQADLKNATLKYGEASPCWIGTSDEVVQVGKEESVNFFWNHWMNKKQDEEEWNCQIVISRKAGTS